MALERAFGYGADPIRPGPIHPPFPNNTMASTILSAWSMRGLGCVLAVVGSVSCHDGGDQVEGPVTVAPVVKKAVEASAPNAAALSIDPPIVAAATFDGRSGQEVYEQICAMCHGETGDGKGIVPLDRPARSFLTGTFSFGNTRDALFKSVSNGIGGTPMPGFEALLTEDERYAVVDYIIAMGPEREVVVDDLGEVVLPQLPQRFGHVVHHEAVVVGKVLIATS